MGNLSTISNKSFSVLNGMPSYLGIEQKQTVEPEIFSQLVAELLSIGKANKLSRVSVHLQIGTDVYEKLASMLKYYGFEMFTSSVEYYKNLSDVQEEDTYFSYHTIGNSNLTEQEFKELWKRVMHGSANRASTLSIDEQLQSLKHELGLGWERNCGVFYLEQLPVAVCIPHIEPGTKDEGRLFYFGVLPEVRGKGYAGILHKCSLKLLKDMGASYYVGSTHETNTSMQRIFEKSGCKERGRKASYYYYLNK